MQGITGSLVSRYFASELLGHEFQGQLGEAMRERVRGACRRWWREHASALGPVSTPRTVFDAVAVLARALGFQPSSPRPSPSAGFLLARLGPPAQGGALPLLLVVGWSEGLDFAWRSAVRETLAAGTAWCLCTNGRSLRLVDTRRSYARRHLEFDLETVFDDAASFAVLWAVLRREAFLPPAARPAAGQQGPPLIERIICASAERTHGVCRDLRAGVVDAVAGLMEGLLPRRIRGCGGETATSQDLLALQEQALTVVYRVLFWLFAESRGLVPTWHPTYRRSYSMEAVRELAEVHGPARGLWETLQAMSRMAHAGCRAGTLRVTPFNGRLFAPALTPAAESSRPGDDRARRMVLSLTTARGGKGAGRSRIVYRDLGVEELGSVYEAVLDYRPVMTLASQGGRVEMVTGSGVRKATGTFYTPAPITRFIVRRALWPLVNEAPPERILELRVLDPAMGSGAFLVAACRYLAGAYEEALLRSGSCQPSDIGDDERRGFRRLVAQNCLYGVDMNPMAVQLARLSLWLTTLAPDRPLTFLDHRLLVGDSLLGASLDDVARQPFPGSRPAARAAPQLPLLPFGDADGALRGVLPSRLRLAGIPDDSLAAVREKEALLSSISGKRSPLARWKAVADAWCALGFGLDSGERPGAGLFAALADQLLRGASVLPADTAARWLERVESTARSRRFFHYTLEFPEVFFDEGGRPRGDGGFDAVLGNPPWDMIRDEGEPGACSAAADASRLARFATRSGVYRALSEGHRNRFQLFVERGVRLARPAGRLGLVVPSGLLSDGGCGPLRRLLFESCAIDAVVAFDNTDRIFPIHRSQRFAVFTATKGKGATALRCRIGERDAAALDRIPDHGGSEHFPVVFTRALLERISGEDLALPDVRRPADLALLERLTASAPPLGAAGGWGVRFGRELNATDDKHLFWDGPHGEPVVEGKHVHPFRVCVPPGAARLRPGVSGRAADLAAAFGRPRLAYRDVACSTNRLTLIAAVVPAGHATVHTVFCLKTALAAADQWFLCGMLNSLVANFLVRLRVSTHVTTAIVSRLPVPRPPAGSRSIRLVASLARGLASSPDPEADPRYVRLQVEAAALYGLTGAELHDLLAGFPLLNAATRERIEESWLRRRAAGGTRMK